MASGAAQAGEAGHRPASLCQAKEQTFFNCAVRSGKLLSLCGTAPAGIAYRFGRPKKVELQVTAPLKPDDNTFQLARYHRAGVERSTVRFEREGVSYLLYQSFENGREEAGIDITLPGQATERRIACRAPWRAKLQQLEGRMACDRESALQLGRCP